MTIQCAPCVVPRAAKLLRRCTLSLSGSEQRRRPDHDDGCGAGGRCPSPCGPRVLARIDGGGYSHAFPRRGHGPRRPAVLGGPRPTTTSPERVIVTSGATTLGSRMRPTGWSPSCRGRSALTRSRHRRVTALDLAAISARPSRAIIVDVGGPTVSRPVVGLSLERTGRWLLT